MTEVGDTAQAQEGIDRPCEKCGNPGYFRLGFKKVYCPQCWGEETGQWPDASPSAGRPTKLTATFLDAAEQVMATDDVIFFTDAELLAEINDRLPDEAQISKRTFESWKAVESDDPNGIAFLRLIEKALRREKRSLFERLRSKDDPQWTRWAWIIERKFDEWNIKRKLGIGTLPKDPAQTLVAAVLGDAPDEES